MKKIWFLSVLVSLSAFARTQHWNSIECKGKMATYSSSFSEGGDSEESTGIIGTKLKAGVHFKTEAKAVAEVSFKENKEKCVDDAGNNLGDLNSTERKFTQLVEITFKSSKAIPQNLRNQKITDMLFCVEKFEETSDECL